MKANEREKKSANLLPNNIHNCNRFHLHGILYSIDTLSCLRWTDRWLVFFEWNGISYDCTHYDRDIFSAKLLLRSLCQDVHTPEWNEMTKILLANSMEPYWNFPNNFEINTTLSCIFDNISNRYVYIIWMNVPLRPIIKLYGISIIIIVYLRSCKSYNNRFSFRHGFYFVLFSKQK